jgi:hypothetical protein
MEYDLEEAKTWSCNFLLLSKYLVWK